MSSKSHEDWPSYTEEDWKMDRGGAYVLPSLGVEPYEIAGNMPSTIEEQYGPAFVADFRRFQEELWNTETITEAELLHAIAQAREINHRLGDMPGPDSTL